MKKVLSILMALLLVFGSFSIASANNSLTQGEKIDWLVREEVIEGRKINADGSADLDLDENVTRAEITKLLVYVLGKQDLATTLKGTLSPFNDVLRNHWANGFITVATSSREDMARGRRIIIGYPNGNFYPERNVNFAELSAMLVRIVKDDLTRPMENNSVWPDSYMNWAAQEGIFKGMVIPPSSREVSRRDSFEMIYNAMFELGLIKEREKSDITTLRGVSINRYPGIVDPRNTSSYNIDLPNNMDPRDVKARDISILTTDENAIVTTPVSSENGRLWRFEVIAANGINSRSYTITINGGVIINKDTSLRKVSARGVSAVVDKDNDLVYNLSLPSSIDPRALLDSFIITTTNPDATVTKVYRNSDNDRVYRFSVIATDGVTRADYLVNAGPIYKEPKAGLDLQIRVGGSVSKADAKAAIDPNSYNINDIEDFYWEVPPKLDKVAEDVLGKVKVLYKDGSSRIVDVKVDVIGNERVYLFDVIKSDRYSGGFKVEPSSNNPDKNLSLNIDSYFGDVNPVLKIYNNLNTKYTLSKVELSGVRPSNVLMTRSGDLITLTNMKNEDKVTLRIEYKVK